ncbi:unnamed protein product [Symbiodinium necroappetens]|uniref:Uncharacterized protein n=1 Tax=Symbiodinium necroappetens TaxID=1628268 RepID=A0A812UKU1_9DINO|nr:unnamed protein product [Symbiodinium necroappetens]
MLSMPPAFACGLDAKVSLRDLFHLRRALPGCGCSLARAAELRAFSFLSSVGSLASLDFFSTVGNHVPLAGPVAAGFSFVSAADLFAPRFLRPCALSRSAHGAPHMRDVMTMTSADRRTCWLAGPLQILSKYCSQPYLSCASATRSRCPARRAQIGVRPPRAPHAAWHRRGKSCELRLLPPAPPPAASASMGAKKGVAVMCPFFLVAGALHVEDPLDLYVLNDPLGVRGRLGLFYARPMFKRAAEVEQAAASITTARFGLETNIAGVFKAVMKAHDPVHSASPAHFEQFKGYSFRIYGLSDEAKQAFHGVFDEHTKAHEKAHLVDMGKAKFHSKAKTKFLRHSLVVHICEQARLGSTPQAWAGELPLAALRFGQLLS